MSTAIVDDLRLPPHVDSEGNAEPIYASTHWNSYAHVAVDKIVDACCRKRVETSFKAGTAEGFRRLTQENPLNPVTWNDCPSALLLLSPETASKALLCISFLSERQGGTAQAAVMAPHDKRG